MGDPVCWLNKVCPECGAFNEDPTEPCWRCGHKEADPATQTPTAPAEHRDGEPPA